MFTLFHLCLPLWSFFDPLVKLRCWAQRGAGGVDDAAAAAGVPHRQRGGLHQLHRHHHPGGQSSGQKGVKMSYESGQRLVEEAYTSFTDTITQVVKVVVRGGSK